MRFLHRIGPIQMTGSTRHRSRGQVVVMFAGGIIFFVGLLAIIVDVSWYWANSLRVQRAADSAALAGALYLPGDVASAVTYAKGEATKNGYTSGSGVTITPVQDASDPRQLDVTVSAPVNMYFMRVFGINSLTATRTAKAVFVQPVPMGSPISYYGVGCYDLTATHPTCANTGSSNGASGVATASGGANNCSTQLCGQGFWGAVQTRGGNKSNGDAYSPANNNTSCPSGCGANAKYDSWGYDYSVDFSAAAGSLYVFDPTFCAMGSNSNAPSGSYAGGSGNYGTGDHWLNGTNPVSTYYTVWDTHGSPFRAAYTMVYYSNALFEAKTQSDQSQGGPTGMTNCAADTTHNAWWKIPIVSSLMAGTYKVEIQTSKTDHPSVGALYGSGAAFPADATINAGTDAENMFSLMATGGGTSRIYGSGKMASYSNLAAGTQLFYLAQIDQTAAGKTLAISLFDAGDVGGGAWLQIKSPDGNAYSYASFSWSADANASSGHTSSGGTVSCIQTNGGSSATAPSGCPGATTGGTFFQNSWLTINIPVPDTYGSVGLTPTGEPSAGWWKIEYKVAGGNDLTTWEVNLRGNPVHLVVP